MSGFDDDFASNILRRDLACGGDCCSCWFRTFIGPGTSFVGLLGDKKLLDLPRGVDQYLELREKAISGSSTKKENKSTSSAAEQRQAKKDLARIERQIAKIEEKIAALLAEQELSEFSSERLAAITGELADLNLEKSRREEEWLAATLLLEG